MVVGVGSTTEEQIQGPAAAAVGAENSENIDGYLKIVHSRWFTIKSLNNETPRKGEAGGL